MILEARYFYSSCSVYGNCSSTWYSWGRWVLLGVIVGVFILAILLMRTWSSQRVRRGHAPVYGTAWMLPPSYHQSQQQYGNPSAPPYQQAGNQQQQGSAGEGYYDQNGNYVQYSSYAPPSHPPPTAQTGGYTENFEMNSAGGSQPQPAVSSPTNGKKTTTAPPPPAYGAP